MEEALEILRLVWTAETTSYEGRFHRSRAHRAPPPVQQPHPPLWVAGVADAAIDAPPGSATPGCAGRCSRSTGRVECLATYRAACERLAATTDWILRRYAWVTPTPPGCRAGAPRLRRRPRRALARVGRGRGGARAVRRIDAGEDVAAEEIADDRLLWGAPDDVIAQIERYRT